MREHMSLILHTRSLLYLASKRVRNNLHLCIEFTSCLFYMLIPLQTLFIQGAGYIKNVSRCAKSFCEKLSAHKKLGHKPLRLNLSICSLCLSFVVLFGLWGSFDDWQRIIKLFHLILHSSFIIVLSLFWRGTFMYFILNDCVIVNQRQINLLLLMKCQHRNSWKKIKYSKLTEILFVFRYIDRPLFCAKNWIRVGD